MRWADRWEQKFRGSGAKSLRWHRLLTLGSSFKGPRAPTRLVSRNLVATRQRGLHTSSQGALSSPLGVQPRVANAEANAACQLPAIVMITCFLPYPLVLRRFHCRREMKMLNGSLLILFVQRSIARSCSSPDSMQVRARLVCCRVSSGTSLFVQQAGACRFDTLLIETAYPHDPYTSRIRLKPLSQVETSLLVRMCGTCGCLLRAMLGSIPGEF